MEGYNAYDSSVRRLFAILALTGGIAYRQQLTGSISGVAHDQSQSAIPNAKVEVKNEASGDVRTSVTNTSGFFTVTALQPGSYTITISAQASIPGRESGAVLNQQRQPLTAGYFSQSWSDRDKNRCDRIGGRGRADGERRGEFHA